MNKILPLIAVLALAGCTTTSDVYLKNGEQGLTIDCSGEANSWASCYEKPMRPARAPVTESSAPRARQR
jgi:hypothetical protein